MGSCAVLLKAWFLPPYYTGNSILYVAAAERQIFQHKTGGKSYRIIVLLARALNNDFNKNKIYIYKRHQGFRQYNYLHICKLRRAARDTSIARAARSQARQRVFRGMAGPCLKSLERTYQVQASVPSWHGWALP